MNILLPLGDMPARGVLESTNTGFSAFTQPGWDLGDIADKITNGIPKGQANGQNSGNEKNAGETAIPDVCAHVQYLRTKLKEERLDFKDQAVLSWIGVLAIIALSEKRGFKLNIEKINLNGDDYLKSVYRSALQKEHLLDSNSQLHVLTLFGNPIAALDIYPKGNPIDQYRCFCYPFSTIDNPAAVMNQVPWFNPGGMSGDKRLMHEWKDVTGDTEANTPYLSQEEKAFFTEWVAALKEKNGYPLTSSIDMENAVSQLIDRIGSDISNCGDLITVEMTMNNPIMRPQNLSAWRGALACVALSKFRGNEITLKNYGMVGSDDLLHMVKLRHEGKSSLVYVCSDGQRIGLLDEDLLIRPMYYADSLQTHTIPWYKDEQWLEISDLNQLPKDKMHFQERGMLATWYQQIANLYTDPTLVTALKKSAEDIINNAVPNIPILNKGTIDDFRSGGIFKESQAPIPVVYTNLIKSLKDVPDLDISMPPLNEIFTDKLVLTMAENPGDPSELGILNPNINNTIVISNNDPYEMKVEKFIALIPLRAGFISRLGHGTGTLQLKNFNLSLDASGSKIIATLQVQNGTVTILKQKEYDLHTEVIYSAECPYMSMWPYIRSDAWKRYYVTCSKEPSAYLNSKVFADQEIELEPMVMDGSEIDTVKMQNMNKQWKLITFDAFPEYIPMQTTYNGVQIEIGSIYVELPQINHVIQPGKTYYASIDFGSSNTIVCLIDNTGQLVTDAQGEAYKLFTNKYVKPLTKWCAPDGDNYYRSVKEFHEYSWLYFMGQGESGKAFWKNDASKAVDRLPTVVQAYEGISAASNEVPRYGRFMRSNCNVIQYFLGKAEEKETSLETLGVKSNIKMSSMVNAGTSEDGVLAVEHILIECVLAAIDHDASLSYIVSYPDKRMWHSLKRYWKDATNNVLKLCNNLVLKSDVLRVTEIQAAHAYANKFAGNVDPNVGYAIVDIGGGTSDISLWLKDEQAGEIALREGLSLKYAGNQIVAETVFSFYRKLYGVGNAELQNFKNLWNVDFKKKDVIIANYEKMMEDGFEKLCKQNFSMAHSMQYMRQQVPILSDTMIGSVGFSNMIQLGNPAVQPFIALLRAKVTSVFYITAKLLEMSEAHDKGKVPLAPYCICLAGNGAQALTMCGDQMTPFLENMMKQLVKIDKKFKIENTPKNRKTEVVMGMAKLVQIAANGSTSNVTQDSLGEIQKTQGRVYVIPKEDLQQFQAVMWDSYNVYVEYIIKPFAEDLFSVDGMTTIYDMLTLTEEANKQMYYARYTSAINEAIVEVEPGTPLYVVAQIAAMKLVDYVLFMKYC